MITFYLISLFCGAATTIGLLIWFKTNAFVEYASVFRLNKILHIDEFKDASYSDPLLTYPKFLVYNWDSFFTRLLVCPICLSWWFAFFSNLLIFVVLAIVRHKYIMLLCPLGSSITSMLAGLFLYFKLVKLMNNE